MKKIFTSKYIYLFLAIALGLLLLVMERDIALYVLSFFTKDASIHATAHNDVKFRVYYLDNDFFEKGPVIRDIHYLMSFTDYIEAEDSFRVELSQPTTMHYEYTVTETLLIRYHKGNDRNTNPVVYRKATVHDKKEGEIVSDSFSFGAHEDDVPGGIYTLSPKEHIETYKNFKEAEMKQMETENVKSERAIDFSAELLIDFTYYIWFAETETSETITTGLLIPLSDEVFSLESTGAPMFDIVLPIREFVMPRPLIITLLILLTGALIAGIYYGAYRFKRDENPKRRELNAILKKYSDEIIFSVEPIDLSDYQIIQVPDFLSLLKLAINTSRHILCFRYTGKADFSVAVEGCAYCYEIVFDESQ